MKPIFVCYSNDYLMIPEIQEKLSVFLKDDYYVLVLHKESVDISFELFNSELEEKDFLDLKKKLIDNIK